MVKATSNLIRWNRQANYYAACDELVRRRFKAGTTDGFRAVQHHGCNPDANTWDVELPTPHERRRMMNMLSRDQGAAGAWLVPSGIATGFMQSMAATSVIRELSTVIQVDGAHEQFIATISTNSVEASIVNPGQTVTNTDVSFGRFTYNLKKFVTPGNACPNELLQDGSNFLEQFGLQLGLQIGRGVDKKLLSGVGGQEPRGILNTATSVTSSTSNALVSDDLFKLLSNIGSYYAARPESLTFMMHPTTWYTSLRSLKEGAGGYILRNVDSGLNFAGCRVALNAHMSSATTTGSQPIILADFSRFVICETPIRFQAIEEVNADKDETLLRAISRCDGQLIDCGDTPGVVLTIQ